MNFKDTWDNKKYQELIKYLESLQDKKYQEFHAKIIDYNNLIGVKTNILKNIAKEISKGDYKSFLEVNTSNLYELVMIEGLIYGFLKIPFQELLDYLNNYLPKIKTWAHVDLTVSNLKLFKKSPKEGFKYAKKLTHTKNTWSKRMGIVILLNYYSHDTYIDNTLEVVTKLKTKDYYVGMAVAWLVSTSYIRYKEKTLIYIVNIQDDFIYNKTLSKIIDSRRISDDEKKFIKSLKRATNKKIGNV